MRKILNQLGFSLMEVLISMGFVVVIASGVGTYVNLTSETKRRIDTGANLANLKEILIRTLNSPGAWNVTIANNPSLGCLKLGSAGCNNGDSGIISVYDIGGNVISSAATDAGFNKFGNACTGFNAAVGNDACSFHYTVRWTAQCSFLPCKDPQVRIDASVAYVPQNQKLKEGFNAERFSFTFYRDETVPNSVEAVCVSLGGTFNSGTNSCNLPWANFTCPAGQMVRGMNTSNIPSCIYPSAMSCPVAGTILRAIQADGTAVCAPLSCVGWQPPVNWTEEPPGFTYTDWFSSGGGDGSCDGMDGGCGS